MCVGFCQDNKDGEAGSPLLVSITWRISLVPQKYELCLQDDVSKWLLCDNQYTLSWRWDIRHCYIYGGYICLCRIFVQLLNVAQYKHNFLYDNVESTSRECNKYTSGQNIRAPANQLGKSSRSKRGMNDSGKFQIQNQKSHFAFIILMTFVFLCVNSLCLSVCVLESFFVSSFDSLDAMISFDICSACKFHVTDSNTDLAFIVVIVVCDCKWNDVENKMSNLCERFTEC